MSHESSSREPNRKNQKVENLSSILDAGSEDNHDGILGLSVEHEVVTAEQRRKIKARRRNTMVTAFLVFAVALVMVISIISPQMGWFKRKDYSGAGNGTSISFEVQDGATNTQIAVALEEQGVIADANRFLENYNKKVAGHDDLFIQPGEYQLEEEMSSDDALNILLKTDSADEIYVAVSQNLRINETFDAMVATGAVSLNDLNTLNADPSQFGIPSKFPSLEGWLHPGEYRFAKGTSAKDMIQQMVDKTKQDLENAGVTGDDRIFHVLTVASILEFEGTPKDYSQIAGAIENRMNNVDGETSGFIQSDATVAYGLGKKSYHISNAEKQDASNKYNTFYYKGLPEGPIGSPAEDAIKAAANPDKNDYYFWVTVNLDTGETKYAKTYEEHLKNVEEYDKWCENNEGKCS